MMTAQQSSFKSSVNEARLASEKREFCKFSLIIWSAFSKCIKVYNQENFGVNITTQDELKLFFTSVCAGLNRSIAVKISNVWVDAFWYHSLLDAGFIPKDEMDDIIYRLDQVPGIFEQADVKKIREKLICVGLLETQTTLKLEPEKFKKYDFYQFLKTAKEMNFRKPSDVVLFCELIYGAAITCLKKFFLRDPFNIFITSHKANIDLMKVVINSFTDSTDSGKLSKAWTHAQNCHTNFYELKNITEKLKQNILNSVGGMNDLIEKADIDMINKNLKPFVKQMETLPTKKTVTIGNESFEYNKTASWYNKT